jgi:hypothetical protein
MVFKDIFKKTVVMAWHGHAKGFVLQKQAKRQSPG